MRKAGYIIFAIVIIMAVSAAYMSWQVFGKRDVPAHSRELVVEQGQSVKQIARSLADLGIIKNEFWFRVQVWLRAKQGDFLAGRFDLPDKVSPSELIRILTTSGKREVRTIKILEGWGISDIAKYFEEEGIFSQEEFYGAAGREAMFATIDNVFFNELVGDYPILKSTTAAAPLEGYLFPDTYEIFADAPVKDVIRKMVDNFDKKVTQDLRDEVEQQGKNFYKVLIMASIIEAEVPHEQDRAIVSDILWSRLESGVALQSDATLNYRIGSNRPALTSEQLKIDTVYNTYMYREFPPTPIGNPGISAIRAAIYPADTDYFYFLSTPKGETIFSSTLDEHNAAKNKYLN